MRNTTTAAIIIEFSDEREKKKILLPCTCILPEQDLHIGLQSTRDNYSLQGTKSIYTYTKE